MYDEWADLITVSTYSCNIACTEELDVAFVDLISHMEWEIPRIVPINSAMKNFNHNKQSKVVELNYDDHNPKSNIL